MEKNSNRLRKIAPRTPRPDKEINELRGKKNSRIKEVIETVKRDADMEKSNAQELLNQAKLVGEKIAIRDAESKLEQIKRINDERIDDVINRFKVDAFFRKNIQALPSDDIYAVEDFYDEIDKRMQAAFPNKFKEQPATTERNDGSSSPSQVVAGGSRSSPNPKKVKLSQEDVRLANKWGIPLEQYAAEKMKVTKSEGDYTTINMQRGGK